MTSKYNESIEKAINYLVCFFNKNGVWKDFYIEQPGMSDLWVTAYVGLCIIESKIYLDNRLINIIEKSASFLENHKNSDGGWGYNCNCRSDCDTTAIVLSFLNGIERYPELDSFYFLLKAQNKDGGFSTYIGDNTNAWNISHVDVTAMVVSAFEYVDISSDYILNKAKLYLNRWFEEYSLPPAYWWNSNLYTALYLLKCFNKFNWEFPEKKVLEACENLTIPKTNFELSMLIELIFRLNKSSSELSQLCKTLISKQNSDGSFEGSEILRVTDTKCFYPWNS